MNLTINTHITEDHFKGTFNFPDDIDFLGESTKVQFFVDCFNEMIKKRLSDLSFKRRVYKRQEFQQINYDERS